MSFFPKPAGVVLLLLLVSFGQSLVHRQGVQDGQDAASPEQALAGDNLQQSVARLESRVEALEQILFAAKQLELREARRRLDRAKQQLSDTRVLFAQGIISDMQLAQDRFGLLIAEQELRLAEEPGRARQLVVGLDLLEARRRLEMARLNLRQTELENQRGFSSLTQVEYARREFTAAEESLDFAKKQAEAAGELQATDDKDPGNPTR